MSFPLLLFLSNSIVRLSLDGYIFFRDVEGVLISFVDVLSTTVEDNILEFSESSFDLSM
jgi:hypothetical protein